MDSPFQSQFYLELGGCRRPFKFTCPPRFKRRKLTKNGDKPKLYNQRNFRNFFGNRSVATQSPLWWLAYGSCVTEMNRPKYYVSHTL